MYLIGRWSWSSLGLDIQFTITLPHQKSARHMTSRLDICWMSTFTLRLDQEGVQRQYFQGIVFSCQCSLSKCGFEVEKKLGTYKNKWLQAWGQATTNYHLRDGVHHVGRTDGSWLLNSRCFHKRWFWIWGIISSYLHIKSYHQWSK